jgi:hypothetical protein
MLYVLIMVCINGAQGCTYSTPSVIVGSPGMVREVVVGFTDLTACEKEAREFTEREGDPDIFEVCRQVALPAPQEGQST